MPATLYLVPNADAAFEHAAGQLRSPGGMGPAAPRYLLLPGASAIAEASARLKNSAGVHVLEFYGLGRLILDRVGEPVYRIKGTASRRLVRRLLEDAQAGGDLTSFGAVWDKPGFTQVLVEWLREMKAQNVTPDQVSAQAAASGSERDRQLGMLYNRYQAFLTERGCADAEGMLWLAAEALERDPDLIGEGVFLALGFDQFSPVHLRILKGISRGAAQMGVYLPWDDDRPENSLALVRLRSTRAALEAALHPSAEVMPEAGGTETQAPALAGLRRCLFDAGSAPAAGGGTHTEAAIAAVAAPSREAEVRRALAGAKSLLLGGVRPESIALACPILDRYARIVQAVAQEYGVPVAVEQPLSLNPTIAALADVLSVAPDFPRRATLDALRSPYVRQPWLSPEQIGQLDRLTRERPVLAGRDQWGYALQPIERPAEDEDEDLGAPPLAATLPPEALAAIRDGLIAFFDHVTPPPAATHREYALWLQEAILGLREETGVEEEQDGGATGEPGDVAGEDDANRIDDEMTGPAGKDGGMVGLDMLGCASEGEHAERDRAALAAFLAGLRELVDAASLVPPAGDAATPWAAFREEVAQELAGLTVPAGYGEAAVPFLALVGIRTRPVDHLFVLGLAEGEFPAAPGPDVFYTTAEREPGGYPLPLARVEPGEDASLWWQVLGNCRRSLTLLHPRYDETGAEWLPSAYWDEVLGCVTGLAGRVEKPAIAAPPPAAEAAGWGELLVALALARQANEESVQGAPMPTDLARAWNAAQRASRVSGERAGAGRCGTYEGVLLDPGLREALAARYGPDHSWSASRLNRFGDCPYCFFAGSALSLEPLDDPEEGLDARQRGSLIHRILELLYGKLGEAGLAPEPAAEQEALRLLDDCCEWVFRSAAVAFGFRPGPLWRYEQAEIRRMLAALVRWECARSDAGSFRPWRQELRFGVRGAAMPAVPVEGPDGEACLVHGVIDRIDRDAAGRLRVIDYKTGSQALSKNDVTEGRALQTALYALAAGENLPGRPAIVESCYLHVPTRETSGRLTFDGPVAENEMVRQAAGQAADFARRAASGQFPAGPSKLQPGRNACVYTCDFAGLCAPTRDSIRKARIHIREEGRNGAD